MPVKLSLHLVIVLAGVLADPAPGRIPKVYNALITSNQNLEPSKAFPVYQPVIHDTFAFPFQPPIFYPGQIPISGIIPASAVLPNNPNTTPAPLESPKASSTTAPPSQPPEIKVEDEKPASTPAPPPPPNTESPIPLNEFGLPSQVTPLGRIDPAYNGFTQVGPFTYMYPSIKFYDPYEPFSFSTFTNLSPVFSRPLTNVLEPSFPVLPNSVPRSESTPVEQSAQTPPPEPNDINLLNYQSKDPAIPNVPPPPLPQGGLKSDKPE